jgi:serine/threonine-protein kinase RsbW
MAQELELSLPSRPQSLAEARSAATALVAGLSNNTQDGVRVVVSELVTNAIKHGPGGEVTLRLRREGLSVRGEVEDEGHGNIDIGRENAGPHGGFGLRVVNALTDRWGIEKGSTHVWFEFTDPPA